MKFVDWLNALISSISNKQMFRNVITTDGYSCSLHFSRRKPDAEEPLTCHQDLKVEDFCTEEVEEFFRPCAVDPGVTNLITAAYGAGRESHDIRSFSNNEYYAMTGSKRRNYELNKKKEASGIADIESRFPSARTVRMEEYGEYLTYFFRHSQELREFYTFETSKTSFENYQGRQRALEETANILINGGRKYDRGRQKKKKQQHASPSKKTHKQRCQNRKNKRKKKRQIKSNAIHDR